jgi:hypothetical protein
VKSVRLTHLAWAIAALVVADLALTFLSGRAFIAACTAMGVIAYAAISRRRAERVERATERSAERIERATERHAERMEKATAAHTEHMRNHVLAIEKFFSIAIRSETTAKIDAARLREGTHDSDTGPFRVYNGRAW